MIEGVRGMFRKKHRSSKKTTFAPRQTSIVRSAPETDSSTPACSSVSVDKISVAETKVFSSSPELRNFIYDVSHVQKIMDHTDISIIQPICVSKEVYVAKYHGMQVVVKKQPISDSSTVKPFKEAAIQRMLSEEKIHGTAPGFPFIVSFVDHFSLVHSNSHVLVMQYCEFGTLLDFVRYGEHVHISINQLFQFSKDVAMGLAFMHSCGVAHRDLKLENIFLAFDPSVKRVVAKIGDFGYSTMATISSEDKIHCGSPDYSSPELEGSSSLSISPIKCDYWAYGVCLYSMFEGRFPFTTSRSDPKSLAEERDKNYLLHEGGIFIFDYSIMISCFGFQDIVERLLAFDPRYRLPISDALQHPFFVAVNPEAISYQTMTIYFKGIKEMVEQDT